MKMINVVAAAIIRDGRCLAARRSESMSLPGLWEFPGGKIESDEDPQDALVREIREELGVGVVIDSPLATTLYAYEFATIELTTFYATLTRGEPRPSEHSALRWCARAELAHLDWAPADIPAVQAIRAGSRIN